MYSFRTLFVADHNLFIYFFSVKFTPVVFWIELLKQEKKLLQIYRGFHKICVKSFWESLLFLTRFHAVLSPTPKKLDFTSDLVMTCNGTITVMVQSVLQLFDQIPWTWNTRTTWPYQLLSEDNMRLDEISWQLFLWW